MSSRARKLISVAAIAAVVVAAVGFTVIAGAETTAGTGATDKIVGTSGSDELSGRGGSDKIRGKGGDDEISGNGGADTLVGGGGNDSIDAGSGNDEVKVADGRVDAVECGSGRDRVKGDAGRDVSSGCEAGASQLADFADEVEVSIAGDYLRVQGNGIPDHETGSFPNGSNPNSISEQDYDFLLPLEPELADEPTETGGGAIGITLSGATFYNPDNALGQDAVMVETFDSCAGHPDPQGAYHYHQYSTCIADDGEGHSEVWAYALDGFAVYGPDGTDGEPPSDLDECNGHSHGELGYHYHATAETPYLIGCFAGEVEVSAGPPAGGPPMTGGLAAGLVGVPLVLLGGVGVLLRRRALSSPRA